MNTFFTADLHFNHGKILESRPFQTIEEMNQVQIEKYNSVVGPKDLVYILGDLAWRNHKKFISALKGKKILIRGNHDKMNQECLKLFTEVYDIRRIKIDRQRIVLFHNPLVSWDGSCNGSWHFYGHSHGKILEYPDKLCCDVGVDVWDYQPVPYEVLQNKMQDRIEAYLQRMLFQNFDGQKRVEALLKENIGYLKR